MAAGAVGNFADHNPHNPVPGRSLDCTARNSVVGRMRGTLRIAVAADCSHTGYTVVLAGIACRVDMLAQAERLVRLAGRCSLWVGIVCLARSVDLCGDFAGSCGKGLHLGQLGRPPTNLVLTW